MEDNFKSVGELAEAVFENLKKIKEGNEKYLCLKNGERTVQKYLASHYRTDEAEIARAAGL
jgi:hypothetical protein